MEFLKKWIIGFNPLRVLIVLIVVCILIALYTLGAFSNKDETELNMNVLKTDASTVSIEILQETNYIILEKEISKTNFTKEEISNMSLLGDYSEVSYYTKLENDKIQLYITLIGTGKYKDFELKDYEL